MAVGQRLVLGGGPAGAVAPPNWPDEVDRLWHEALGDQSVTVGRRTRII